jgi:hypothetical protein
VVFTAAFVAAFTVPFFGVCAVATSLHLPQVEAHEDFFRVGEVPDDLLDRCRELPDQGRDGDDLVVLCELGVLDQVDDLDLVAAVKVLSADLLEIVKRGQ